MLMSLWLGGKVELCLTYLHLGLLVTAVTQSLNVRSFEIVGFPPKLFGSPRARCIPIGGLGRGKSILACWICTGPMVASRKPGCKLQSEHGCRGDILMRGKRGVRYTQGSAQCAGSSASGLVQIAGSWALQSRHSSSFTPSFPGLRSPDFRASSFDRAMAATQLLFLAVAMAAAAMVAGDAEVVVDFCVRDPTPGNSIRPTGNPCKALADVTSSDFKFTLVPGAPGGRLNFGIALGFADQWGGLNGLQVAIARLDFGKGGQIPPHHHPRATEIFYVVEGQVLNGFIDTAGTLYEEVVSAGQAFVFPRGLIHYQKNVGKGPAYGISSFNSQNPGLQLTFNAVLESNPLIPSKDLAQALNVKKSEVASLRKAFGA